MQSSPAVAGLCLRRRKGYRRNRTRIDQCIRSFSEAINKLWQLPVANPNTGPISGSAKTLSLRHPWLPLLQTASNRRLSRPERLLNHAASGA
jgi:hypothetical protein